MTEMVQTAPAAARVSDTYRWTQLVIGVAAMVMIANFMQQSSGSWDNVFIIAAGANILASLLAILLLKPWRKTVVEKTVAGWSKTKLNTKRSTSRRALFCCACKRLA